MKSRRRGPVLLLMMAVMGILACSGNVTQANFNRVENDMSFDQVVDVLGEPTESKSMGIGSLSGTSARWESDDAVITITFVNQEVMTKNFKSKSGE